MAMEQKSAVWDHFVRKDSTFVQCSHCPMLVKVKSNSTTNLWSHLKVHHNELFTVLCEKKNRTSDGASPSPKRPKLTLAVNDFIKKRRLTVAQIQDRKNLMKLSSVSLLMTCGPFLSWKVKASKS